MKVTAKTKAPTKAKPTARTRGKATKPAKAKTASSDRARAPTEKDSPLDDQWDTEKGWNEVVLPGGARQLHCMVCGAKLIDAEEGFVDPPCEHLLLFVDWLGELAHVRADFRAAGRRISACTELSLMEAATGDGSSGQRRWRDAILAELPQTAIVLEVVRPGYGSDQGDTMVAVIDLEGCQPTWDSASE